MKPNLLRERLAEGRVPVGHMVMEFATRGVAKIAESAGLDFVLIDMEHSGIDVERVADLLAWFKATPVTPLVRVPSALYHFIARVLDAGALGIMAPNVETVEQARALVAAVKYAPEGHRGLGLGTAHTDYVPPPARDYLREANATTSVICQIESPRGLENVDAIAATDGVDVLWVGQWDLSSSMGILGEFEHPRFVEALRKVAEAARRHGKGAGMQPGSLEQAEAWLALGFNVMSYGSDVTVYRSALATGVARTRELGMRRASSTAP